MDTAHFQSRLKQYQQVIDDDIASYADSLRESIREQYGAYAAVEIDAYLQILERGGKRIRGALTIVGYEMSGGTDTDMIVKAARVIEMMHAYMLIIDDIQDGSLIRRGGPSAHAHLATLHEEKKYSQSSEHFGVSIALNAAIAGAHAAQMILANIDADESLRIKAISILNRTIAITAHGQTYDIMNEVVPEVEQADVERTLELKTAYYTVLNPLHVGMVLAGADCHATDAITDYAVHTGKAFQITDDLLGVYGTEKDSGKNPLDDIREGKRTLLIIHALKHCSATDKKFLLSVLGNSDLTQEQFESVQEILKTCGSYTYATKQARKHVEAALVALEAEAHRWDESGVRFLRGLTQYLPGRAA